MTPTEKLRAIDDQFIARLRTDITRAQQDLLEYENSKCATHRMLRDDAIRSTVGVLSVYDIGFRIERSAHTDRVYCPSCGECVFDSANNT